MEIRGEVFTLREGEWRLHYNGYVARTIWKDKGAAEAQLNLLRSGYSALGLDGAIVHVGAKKEASK